MKRAALKHQMRKVLDGQVRISILALLTAFSDGTACSEDVLLDALNAAQSRPMGISADRLRTELAWLSEQGLVLHENGAALLTERGRDVAEERTTVPGVAPLDRNLVV